MVSDGSEGGRVVTDLMKHSVQNIFFREESVGVEVWPQPDEDLLAHIYI